MKSTYIIIYLEKLKDKQTLDIFTFHNDQNRTITFDIHATAKHLNDETSYNMFIVQ
jgi:hypothetical protein